MKNLGLRLLTGPMLIAVSTTMGTALAAPKKGANDAQTVCAMAAFADYNKANLAIMQTDTLMTVEAKIAQRRLQEEYCIRVTRCLVGDPSNNSPDLPFRAGFAQCLRDEEMNR